MADPRLPVQNIDIPSLWMAIQQSRAANSRAGLEQAQLAQVYAQSQRDAQLRQALSAGDIQAASDIDPEAALDYQGKVLSQQAATQGIEGDKRKATDEFMRSAANALRANPQAAELVARTRDARVKAGQIEHFEIPGWDLAPDIAGPPGGEPSAQQAATLGALGGAAFEQEKQPTEFQLYRLAQENPEFGPWLDRKVRADKGKDSFTIGTDLREEFHKLAPIKAYQESLRHLDTIQGSGDTGPGGIALIFSYITMLDPTSTVNQGEQASAANAGGVGDKIRGLYNSMLEGKSSLRPELAETFRQEARQIMRARTSQAKAAAETYRWLAKQGGANPDEVVSPKSWGGLIGQVPQRTGDGAPDDIDAALDRAAEAH